MVKKNHQISLVHSLKNSELTFWEQAGLQVFLRWFFELYASLRGMGKLFHTLSAALERREREFGF